MKFATRSNCSSVTNAWKIRFLMIAVAGLGLSLAAVADTLELKNGKILNGSYAGGTAGTVRFNTEAGVKVVETSQIVALTFTSTGVPGATPAAPAVPMAAGAQAPTPTPTPQAVTLPAAP